MKFVTPAQRAMFSTVALELADKNGNIIGSGTSFAMRYEKQGCPENIFLVTNKHVLEGAWVATCFFTSSAGNQPNVGKPLHLKMDDNVRLMWHGHPNPEIDVCVMPFGWTLQMMAKSTISAFVEHVGSNMLPNDTEQQEIDAFDEIAFVGYPNGLYDCQNYTPVTRRGTLATPVQQDWNGQPHFLIDASVFPGSSGSPVFLVKRSNKCEYGYDLKLLGIISAVLIQEDSGQFVNLPAPVTKNSLVQIRQMIDLGVVIKTQAIIETIEHWAKSNYML